MSNELDVNPVEPIESIGIDYQHIDIQKGQYWIRYNDLVAFVLDVNDYAVIYQVNVSIGEQKDQSVFDFESGHELLSIESFRDLLEQREAQLVYPPQKNIDLALVLYQNALTENRIFQAKKLPVTEEEAQELRDVELYTQKKRIIPPPLKYRKKKSVHWLKVGLAGNQYTAKLWDPELNNWVYPTGDIDPTATIGYVKSYHDVVALIDDGSDKETIEDFSNRFVDLLRSKNYLFDEKYVKKQLSEQQSLILVEDELPYYEFAINPVKITIKYPNEDTSVEQIKLTILLTHQKVVKFKITVGELLNNEFIKKQPFSIKAF